MFALRPSYETSEKLELKTATLPAKLRPKTYDEIRAKVLEAPRPILTQKGKKKRWPLRSPSSRSYSLQLSSQPFLWACCLSSYLQRLSRRGKRLTIRFTSR